MLWIPHIASKTTVTGALQNVKMKVIARLISPEPGGKVPESFTNMILYEVSFVNLSP